MTRWSTAAVLAASAEWVWVPPDARQRVTGEYHLVSYPSRYNVEAPVQAFGVRAAARPADQVLDEMAGQARDWGHGQLSVWVAPGESPAAGELEAALLGRGATVGDVVQVLGYDMTGGLPGLDLPPGVRTEVVADEATLRDGQRVNAVVWRDGREPDDDAIARDLADTLSSLADWTGFRVVGYLDGEPISYGGCGLGSGVARMWGAGSRPEYRGRGGYRAVLGRRMAVAREHGATLALVKGKVDTSAPILRRAGFTGYGEERRYQLDLGEAAG